MRAAYCFQSSQLRMSVSKHPRFPIDQSIKLELSGTRQAGFVTLAGRALSVYCGERSVCLCNLLRRM